jgi:hypothetical protein
LPARRPVIDFKGMYACREARGADRAAWAIRSSP